MLRVFYSWISDEPQQDNRMLVYRALKDALHQAANRLGTSAEQAEVLQCERFPTPTDIARFILETIPTCHALVGDISFVNAAGENRTRRLPNPNTMFEIGVAMQCLGPGKVILVFNTDSGDPADLPFDIRNHAMIPWSVKDPREKLTRALRGPAETLFRDYLKLQNQFAQELSRCLESLLQFLEEFLLRHIEPQRPGFTEASMYLFDQGPDEEVLLPEPELVADVLGQFKRHLLDTTSSVEGLSEGNLFAIILQRLHLDCERLTYRHPELRGSDLFRSVERVGIEAGHLERLVERVINRVPDLVANEIFVNEIQGFLGHVIEVCRQQARCTSSAEERRQSSEAERAKPKSKSRRTEAAPKTRSRPAASRRGK
jgi:hypothetical protein